MDVVPTSKVEDPGDAFREGGHPHVLYGITIFQAREDDSQGWAVSNVLNVLSILTVNERENGP